MISTTNFDGLVCVALQTESARMVVTTEMGPRIAFWGKPDGENLLYWDKNGYEREGWRLMGGHRVWVTRPLADESEDAYASDNAACTVEQTENSVTITSPPHAILHVSRGLRMTIVDDGKFEVTSFITNHGPMLYSGGVWAPTCIDPSGGKEFGILLGDRDATWDTITVVIPRKFAGQEGKLNDPQVTFTDDFMVVKPQGGVLKRMAQSKAGIVAMSWPQENQSFIKRVTYQPLAQYPMGCNTAVFNGQDNFMFEMETYGPEQTIVPGQTVNHVEQWTLRGNLVDWADPSSVYHST